MSIHKPFFENSFQGLIASIRNSPYPFWYTLMWPYFFRRPAVIPWSSLKVEPSKSQVFSGPVIDKINLLFVGDIMVLNGDTIPHLSSELCDLLHSADIFSANCEAPVGDHKPNPKKKYSFLFHMPRDVLTGILEQAHLDFEKVILSNSNNHSGDAGHKAFIRSQEIFKELGINAIGFQGNENIAKKTVGGQTIGFLGWTHWLNCNVFTYNSSPLMIHHIDDLSFSDVKKTLGIDYLIGIPHWGYEFQHFPSPSTRKHARQLFNRGLDLIVGSHPHVLQPYEWHEEKFCAYSLGNFCGLGVAWPVKLIPILQIVVGKDAQGLTRMLRYETHFFWQRHEGSDIYIEPLKTLDISKFSKVKSRINKVITWHDE